MKPRSSRTVFRLLLGAMVLLVVVGLDFGLTQVHRRLILPPPAHPIFPREKNSTYHHGLRPNSEGWLFYGPLKSYYFSNSLGFRDGKIREVPLDSPGRRVLLIGDSFTEGVGLNWEDTFAGILAKDLAPEGVEVLNAGVNSYCPVLMRLKLRHFIEDRGLRVDRVIVLVDNSDIVDELFYEAVPNGGVTKIQYGPFEAHSRGMAKIDDMSNWMKVHLETHFSLLGVLSRNLRLFVRRQDAKGIAAFEKFVELKRHWPDHRGDLEEFIGRGLAEAKREMTGIAEMLKAQGIPLTLVIYPWPEQIRSGKRPSRVEKEWSSWAEENRVSLINLFPVFLDGTPADEVIRKYYIPGDFHWSPEGNARVAGELLRQGNLGRSGRP